MTRLAGLVVTALFALVALPSLADTSPCCPGALPKAPEADTIRAAAPATDPAQDEILAGAVKPDRPPRFEERGFVVRADDPWMHRAPERGSVEGDNLRQVFSATGIGGAILLVVAVLAFCAYVRWQGFKHRIVVDETTLSSDHPA